MRIKKLLLTSVLAASATLAHAGPTTYAATFQGATFNVLQNSSTDFTFDIAFPSGLTGDWSSATYLNSFAFNTTSIGTSGPLTATLINPATGQSTMSIAGGLSANGCNGSGSFICFNFYPNNIAITNINELEFDITGATFAFASTGPNLKIDWTDSPTSTTHIGSLYSAYISPVPEPESYAMLLAGLGLMGFMARRRKQKVA